MGTEQVIPTVIMWSYLSCHRIAIDNGFVSDVPSTVGIPVTGIR